MAKPTPVPCTALNCGDNFAKCGSASTYANRKCRCVSCIEAKRAASKRYYEANRAKVQEYGRSRYAENRERLTAEKREYYANNREKIAERDKRYREKNPEKIAERKRRYREMNSEAITERERRYYQENRNEINARSRRYYAENRDALVEYRRKYVEENREAVLDNLRRYQQENRKELQRKLNESGRGRAKMHRRRARERAAFVEEVDSVKVFDAAGYICQGCGIDCAGATWPAGNFATLDHIIPLAKGGTHEYSNVQLLCLSCNSRKRDRLAG